MSIGSASMDGHRNGEVIERVNRQKELLKDLLVLEFGNSHDARQRVSAMLEAITTPSSSVYIRVNTLRTTIDDARNRLNSLLPPKFRLVVLYPDLIPEALCVVYQSQHALHQEQQEQQERQQQLQESRCKYQNEVEGEDDDKEGGSNQNEDFRFSNCCHQSVEEDKSSCLLNAEWNENLMAQRYPYAVVVGRTCGEAVLTGADVFAPGVDLWPSLDAECVNKSGVFPDAAAAHAVRVRVYADCYDVLTRGGLTTANQTFDTELFHPLGIGAVHSTLTADAIFSCGSRGVAVQMVKKLYPLPCIDPLVQTKLCLIQHLPSQVAVRVLDPQPGERIIDVCAFPGGKTSHIAQLMQNVGELVALAHTRSKAKRLTSRLCSLGVSCTSVRTLDAIGAVKEFGKCSFDRVLVDAPCSGIGNRPRIGLLLPTPGALPMQQLESLQTVQASVLSAAAELVKPGGIVVYCTCSIRVPENELQVELATKHYGLQVVDIASDIPSLLSLLAPSKDDGVEAQEELSLEEKSIGLRFEPTTLTHSWRVCSRTGSLPTLALSTRHCGFFIAKLQKHLVPEHLIQQGGAKTTTIQQ